MTLHFAVFGQPISHSLSPYIHRAFGKQLGIDLDYTAIEAAPEDFATAVASFAAAGGSGANVTLPHKEAAYALCAEVSEYAFHAGAVNTLIRHNDGWLGDNTDGAGLIRDLTERERLDLRGRRCLMIGAGGAARGVAPALLEAGIAELMIVNRSPGRADKLADILGEPDRVKTRYWEDMGNQGSFELIINATSAGRLGGKLDLPFSLLAPRALAVDLSYGEVAIPFLSWARAGGCDHAVDGLGMLIEQAAESFLRWHGKRPQTDEIYAELRARDDELVTAD
jgi:shikimate dehydrogenase